MDGWRDGRSVYVLSPEFAGECNAWMCPGRTRKRTRRRTMMAVLRVRGADAQGEASPGLGFDALVGDRVAVVGELD